MITLTINGLSQDVEEGTSLNELLIYLRLENKPVVVELNRQALSPSEFKKITLDDGDVLEIITIAAGG